MEMLPISIFRVQLIKDILWSVSIKPFMDFIICMRAHAFLSVFVFKLSASANCFAFLFSIGRKFKFAFLDVRIFLNFLVIFRHYFEDIFDFVLIISFQLVKLIFYSMNNANVFSLQSFHFNNILVRVEAKFIHFSKFNTYVVDIHPFTALIETVCWVLHNVFLHKLKYNIF